MCCHRWENAAVQEVGRVVGHRDSSLGPLWSQPDRAVFLVTFVGQMLSDTHAMPAHPHD